MRTQNENNAEYFGAEKQMVLMIEELAELAQAGAKWLRIHTQGQAVRKTEDEVLESLMEEMADVSIMIDQIKYLLGISERHLAEIRVEKIKRTADIISSQKKE